MKCLDVSINNQRAAHELHLVMSCVGVTPFERLWYCTHSDCVSSADGVYVLNKTVTAPSAGEKLLLSCLDLDALFYYMYTQLWFSLWVYFSEPCVHTAEKTCNKSGFYLYYMSQLTHSFSVRIISKSINRFIVAKSGLIPFMSMNKTDSKYNVIIVLDLSQTAF